MWSKEEIVRYWNEMKYHDENSVVIIADLNGTDKDTIKDILGIEHKKAVPVKTENTDHKVNWTKEETALLEKLLEEKTPYSEIGRILGRNQSSVKNKIDKLRIAKKNDKGKNEIAELKFELLGRDKRIADITAESERLQKELDECKAKIERYESLCKDLDGERMELINDIEKLKKVSEENLILRYYRSFYKVVHSLVNSYSDTNEIVNVLMDILEMVEGATANG